MQLKNRPQSCVVLHVNSYMSILYRIIPLLSFIIIIYRHHSLKVGCHPEAFLLYVGFWHEAHLSFSFPRCNYALNVQSKTAHSLLIQIHHDLPMFACVIWFWHAKGVSLWCRKLLHPFGSDGMLDVPKNIELVILYCFCQFVEFQ